MPRPAFFWSVSSQRAVGEAIAINGLGTLVLSSAPQDQAVFGLGILWIGLACALICNLRATLPAMPLRAAIAYDARLFLQPKLTMREGRGKFWRKNGRSKV